jgi:hypothetical protein
MKLNPFGYCVFEALYVVRVLELILLVSLREKWPTPSLFLVEIV